jgi:hypothetical protein
MNSGAKKGGGFTFQIVGEKKQGPAYTKRQLILCTLMSGAINPRLLTVGLFVAMSDSIFFQRQPFLKHKIEAFLLFHCRCKILENRQPVYITSKISSGVF